MMTLLLAGAKKIVGTFALSHVRLLVTAVAIAAVGAWGLVQRHHATSATQTLAQQTQDLGIANTTIAQLRLANAENATTIDVLEARAIAADHALDSLHAVVQRIGQRSTVAQAQLQHLEATNDTVRDYLDIPVPERVRRLLAPPSDSGARPDRPHGNDPGTHSQRTAATVRLAGAGLRADNGRSRPGTARVARGSAGVFSASRRAARVGC